MNMVISANKARQRLLRLSEAAEKLQRHAAIYVQAGKENDARDLLFQKKKAMQALEKTKSRIELLDELSTKLIEAISLRERQLVGMVSLDHEIQKEDDESPVRVMSPPSEILGVGENSDNNFLDNSDDQEPHDRTNKLPSEHDTEESLQASIQLSTHGVDNISNNDLISSLTGLTSYEDFLVRVDQHLNKVENELITVMKFSTLVLENEEKPKNLKVQQLMEILDAVQNIRDRIAVVMQAEAKI